MKVITVVNEKAGSGCTTVAMLAAMQAAQMKLRTALVEISHGAYDAPLFCGVQGAPDPDCIFDDGKKTGLNIYGNSGSTLNAVLTKAETQLDVLVIDTNEAEEKYFEAADIIIVPAVLDAVSVKHAISTIEKARKLKYPSSMMRVFVNMNDGSMSAADLSEVFKNVEISCFMENSAAWKKAAAEGKAYSVKPDKVFQGASGAVKNILSSINPKALDKRLFNPDLSQLSGDSGAARKEAGRGPVTINDAAESRVINEKTAQEITLKKSIYKQLFAELDIRKMESEAQTGEDKKERMKLEVRKKIHELIDVKNGVQLTREDAVRLEEEIFDEATGYGPIEEFLRDPTVTEIMVNRHDVVFVERRGMLALTDSIFTDDAAVKRVIDRIVMPLGRRIDESSPHVDARLPDGSRVNAIIPPLALDGPVVTIRKFSDKKLSIQDMINFGSVTEEAGEYLKRAVAGKKNIIISGGTGSGKTTLLNVLSSFIPSNERILTIEDSAELKLEQFHVVRLETRPANLEGKGEVTIRDLVRNALRMRPDRIVVGECRGGEALDMLQAMNTGHEGSMTTLHANTPRDAISRLEVMVLTAGVELPVRAIREQIRGAVNIIVQQSRMADGARKITQISEITGMDNDMILMQNAFEFVHDDKPGAPPSAGILKKNNIAGRV